MRDRRVTWRRTLVALAVAGAITTGSVPAADAGPGGAGAPASRRQGEPEPRVRDIEVRVRDLVYETRSLDNSERVEESPEQTSITLAADVLFEFDRADLTPAANTRLDELAAQLTDLGPREVAIAGHTDDHGDTAYNQTLSEQRAQAVQAALDARLGDDFTFAVTGHGEAQPVAANAHDDGSDNPEGRALNRRVEITFPS
jgi:outer membrane protein OmpA-like peptidoglycan-associated protein